jgi:hypothetical protein
VAIDTCRFNYLSVDHPLEKKEKSKRFSGGIKNISKVKLLLKL